MFHKSFRTIMKGEGFLVIVVNKLDTQKPSTRPGSAGL